MANNHYENYDEFEYQIRLFKLDLIRFLNILAITEAIALDVEEISNSTSTAEVNLKGIIGALRRIRIGDSPIILPAGRDEKGRLRWALNKSVIDKQKLARFLENEILGRERLKYDKK